MHRQKLIAHLLHTRELIAEQLNRLLIRVGRRCRDCELKLGIRRPAQASYSNLSVTG